VHGAPRTGFTLIEVLMALVVLGAVATIFTSLLVKSLELNKTNRDTRIATRLAEDLVTQIVQAPGDFYWALPEQAGEDLFRIGLSPDDPPAGNPCAMPALVPANDQAAAVAEAVHERFRWRAFGRLTGTTAHHYEVVVEVHWTAQGRTFAVALTSAVQREAVEAVV